VVKCKGAKRFYEIFALKPHLMNMFEWLKIEVERLFAENEKNRSERVNVEFFGKGRPAKMLAVLPRPLNENRGK